MSNMISTFMELTPFSRQRKSKPRYVWIQMWYMLWGEECGALWLRADMAVLDWVIMKEAAWVHMQQTLHNVHGISDATRQSGAKEPSRRSRDQRQQNRNRNSLAKDKSLWEVQSRGAAWRAECEMTLDGYKKFCPEFYGTKQASDMIQHGVGQKVSSVLK